MEQIFILFAIISICCSQIILDSSQWRNVKIPKVEIPSYKGEILTKFRSQNYRGRIAGGNLAYLGQFPYHSLLYNVDIFGDTYICGAGIISHNWLLTASHCLHEIVRTSIYVGIIDRINGPAVWTLDVTAASGNLILHEEYSGVINDIALIRLVSSIPSHNYVDIISLPSRSYANIDLVGMSATISGFGRTSDISTQPSERLRYVTQTIYENQVCERLFGRNNVRETNLCLSGSEGRSTCQGDSGGPLTADVAGRRTIIGIVSFGAEAGCTLNHPIVFTRVTSYLDWIEKKTGILISN